MQLEALVREVEITCEIDLTWDERPTPPPAPYLVPSDSTLVQSVRRNLEREIGMPARLILQRSVADTNHFAVHGGIPTVVCGPQGGNTCRANEYVEIDSLVPITRATVQTVIDLLGVRE